MSWEIQVARLDDWPDTFAVVGDFESFGGEEVLSDTGSGQVVVAYDALDMDWVEDNCVWLFLQDGVRRGGFIVEAFEDIPLDDDEIRRVKISGRGMGAMLEWAVVYPGNFPAHPKIERIWQARAFPDVLHLFLVEAQNRGTLSLLDLESWSNGPVAGGSRYDSDGVAWTHLVDGSQLAGDDLLTLTKRWAALYPFDWYIGVDLKMHAWNHAGRDLTDDVVFHPGGAIAEQSVTRVRRGLRNVFVIETTGKEVAEYVNTTSVATWKRREQYLKPDEAVDAHSASLIVEPLINDRGSDVAEYVVKVERGVGRDPWVDFLLGDTVGVEFPDGIRPMRCNAIAYAVDSKGNETVEAVVGDVLTTEIADGTSESGGSNPTGTTLVYTDNGPATITVNTSSGLILPMPVDVVSTANLRGGINLQGIASSGATITVEIVMGSTVVKTYKKVMAAGDNNVAMPFVLVGIPEGQQTWRLRASVTSGTFVIQPNDGQWWLEGRNLAGGIGDGADPNVLVMETADVDLAVTDSAVVDLQTPILVSKTEAWESDSMPTVTDDYAVGFVVTPTVGTNDGWISDVPSYTNSTTTLQAGYLAGEMREAFMLFPFLTVIPAGSTIMRAELQVRVDADAAVAPILGMEIEDTLTPTAPTSRADLLSRTWNPESFLWSETAVAGDIKKIDVKALVQAVLDDHVGDMQGVLLHMNNSGPATDAMLVFRSQEHGTGPAPTLVVQWQ